MTARAALATLLFFTALAALLPLAPAGAQPGVGRSVAKPPRATETSKAPEEINAYRLPPEKHAQAVRYARIRYRLYFVGVACTLALLLTALSLRAAPRLRDWAEARSRRPAVQALLFVPPLVLLLDLLYLPLSVYRYRLAVHYGLSVQQWPAWLWDWTKGEALNLAGTTFIVWLLYTLMRRFPRRWWFAFWLAIVPVIAFMVLVTPLVIDPLFNRYAPLARTQPALVTEIEKVVARGGLAVPRGRMFEMKASEKVRSVNAYVTGFGPSKRVVVWDTTVQRLTVPQILAVFGHEMGHYALGHIPRGTALMCLLLLALFWAIYRAARGAVNQWGGRWGIRGLDDWASLPVLLLFFNLFWFLSAPVRNGYSRWVEHQADIYALEVTRAIVPDWRRAAVEAEQILGEINLSDPDPPPFIAFWLYTHPPTADRLEFARTYDPWAKGESPRYVP